ncbi:hypothetical protein EHS13_21855 [Paenibacillus psychroresistens]|uniref:Uncharacterized protein n=1 Tax=Paenibacillus psychroresistens TaxID=1778678 RepID=A0A6B8RLS0_9BACL|nr:hypothetical protein [Paenibacillus psychroresistens]QGQ97341.1 hypothetical protein EHS13_21855 [Paenibacillus psychroresistens]
MAKIIGLLHSWIILYYPILKELKEFPQLKSIISAVLILYFVIYCLFYLSSASVYYKIVNQKNAMS